VNEVYTLVIPALIMGNTVVMKTPRYGVLANALLAPALSESFPPGVVNVLTGSGSTIIGPIMESGLIDVLALIGSVKTAGILLRQHPRPYRLRTVLGLGAKNPAIVLPDADLDLAAKEIVSGALTFNGQRCTAVKHVLAVRGIADALVEGIAAAVAKLRMGMPWEDGVTITPMPDADHAAKIEGLVRDAVTRGARVVNVGGGRRVEGLLSPAVVHPVTREALLFTEEQFGPIVPVSVVDSAEAAIDVVDASNVGQQVALFGRDARVLGPLVDQLANLVCRVNLNTQCRRGPDSFPFTGRKDAAFGTLSLTDALRVFSIRSLVAATEAESGLVEELGGTSRFLAPVEAGR
jgi:glyceraldehyde-3-phosphate dehydrogenase (NADP+)